MGKVIIALDEDDRAFNVGDIVRPTHTMYKGGGGDDSLSPRHTYTVDAIGDNHTSMQFEGVGNQYGWWDFSNFKMVKMAPATKEQVRLVCMKILELVKKFNIHPYKINQGSCEDFAFDLKDSLNRVGVLGLVRGMPEHDAVHDGYPFHYWYEFKGRHYDAEEPYGQRRWQDLPIFHRARCQAKDKELGRLFPEL